MSVRCKFTVISVTRRKHWDRAKGDLFDIEMHPVSSGSDENKAFYEATPNGAIKFGTVNQAAAESLELGAEYYIDISPAPKK